MDWDKYKREIQLIIKQNNVEYELYSLIAELFRSKNSFTETSLRDVSRRRRTKEGTEQLLWGIMGFPDFVVLDTSYLPKKGIEDKEKLFGAIEIKYVNCPLFAKEADIRQLIGHILWFGKVIYTNGIEWYFYERTWDNFKKEKNDSKQNQSYSISNAKEEWISIEKYIDGFSIDKLQPKIIELKKADDFGVNKWNESGWLELIRFLDEELSW